MRVTESSVAQDQPVPREAAYHLPVWRGANLGAHLLPPQGPLAAPLQLRAQHLPISSPVQSEEFDFDEMLRELFPHGVLGESGVSPTSPSAEERIEANKARNRAAQKRFRDRYKARHAERDRELEALKGERMEMQAQAIENRIALQDANERLTSATIAYEALLIQLQRVNTNRIELETYISELTAVMNFRDAEAERLAWELPSVPELGPLDIPPEHPTVHYMPASSLDEGVQGTEIDQYFEEAHAVPQRCETRKGAT